MKISSKQRLNEDFSNLLKRKEFITSNLSPNVKGHPSDRIKIIPDKNMDLYKGNIESIQTVIAWKIYKFFKSLFKRKLTTDKVVNIL